MNPHSTKCKQIVASVALTIVAVCASAAKAQASCRDIGTEAECHGAVIEGFNCRWSCSSIIPRPCICLQGDKAESSSAVSFDQMEQFVQQGSNVLSNASIFTNGPDGTIEAVDADNISTGDADADEMVTIDSATSSNVPDGLELSSEDVQEATLDANFASGDVEGPPAELDDLEDTQPESRDRGDKEADEDGLLGTDATGVDTLMLPLKALPVLKGPKLTPFMLLKKEFAKFDPLKKYTEVLQKLDKLFDETGPIVREVERMKVLKNFLQVVDQKLDAGDPVALYIAALKQLQKVSPLDLKVGLLQKLHENVLSKPKKNKKLSGLALLAFKALKLAVLKGLVLKLGSEYVDVLKLADEPLQQLVGSIPLDINPLTSLGFVDNLGSFTPLQDLLGTLNIDLSSVSLSA